MMGETGEGSGLVGIESRSVLRPPNRWEEEEEDDIAGEDTDSLLIAALESCCLLNFND